MVAHSIFILFQLIRFKQNIVKHDTIEEILCPYETAFLQYVGDNTDHDLATVDGKTCIMDLVQLQLPMETFQTLL